jgi:hypothetical protein
MRTKATCFLSYAESRHTHTCAYIYISMTIIMGLAEGTRKKGERERE